MKKYLGLLLAICILGPFMMGAENVTGGCNDADTQDSRAQRESLAEARAQVGMPAIKNWTEKKEMKMLYELRDQENLQTYTYIVAENTGKLIFLGRSVGFGIPYSTQFTCPTNEYNHPQAEPNGLFMPSDAEGTWVMLVDKKGDIHPTYIEPRVVVSTFPLSTDAQ